MGDKYTENDLIKFMGIYKGDESKYTIHTPTDVPDNKGKKAGKYEQPKDYTKPKGADGKHPNIPLTTDDYRDHLNGKKSIAVWPIVKGKATFSVIDIDVYSNTNIDIYFDAIERLNFPIVPVQSKSGGWHLSTYYDMFIDVEEARNYSRTLAKILGLDRYQKDRGLEIKPINLGINLPYLDAENTSRAVVINGKKLDLKSALEVIEKRTISKENMQPFLDNLPLSDAPCFMQTAYILGNVGEGERDNYLTDLGIYFAHSKPNDIYDELIKANDLLTKNNIGIEPKTEQDIDRIATSVAKTEYKGFRSDHKDSSYYYADIDRNKGRKYSYLSGGKRSVSGIIIGKIDKIMYKKPSYYIHARRADSDNYERVFIKNADELLNQKSVIARLFAKFDATLYPMKQKDWFDYINNHRNKGNDIEPEFDMTDEAQLNACIVKYFRDCTQAKTLVEFRQGLPYYDAKNKRHFCNKKGAKNAISTDDNCSKIDNAFIGNFLNNLFGKSKDRLTLYDFGKPVSAYYIDEDKLLEIDGSNDSDTNDNNITTDIVKWEKSDLTIENKTDDEIEQELIDSFNDNDDGGLKF